MVRQHTGKYRVRYLPGLSRNGSQGLNGIRTRDPCDTGTVLYQLSYQANWELLQRSLGNLKFVQK